MAYVQVIHATCPCDDGDCWAPMWTAILTHTSIPKGFVVSVESRVSAQRAVLDAYEVLTMNRGVWPVRRRKSTGALESYGSLAKDGTR